MDEGTTVEFLESFAAAWNRHDLDAIMAAMTEDCVFKSSDGTDYEGREAVRREFGEILSDLPNARWGEGLHFASGDRGLSEWLFSATGEDGVRFEMKGCDVFVFRDGKIACKDTYLKQ